MSNHRPNAAMKPCAERPDHELINTLISRMISQEEGKAYKTAGVCICCGQTLKNAFAKMWVGQLDNQVKEQYLTTDNPDYPRLLEMWREGKMVMHGMGDNGPWYIWPLFLCPAAERLTHRAFQERETRRMIASARAKAGLNA